VRIVGLIRTSQRLGRQILIPSSSSSIIDEFCSVAACRIVFADEVLRTTPVDHFSLLHHIFKYIPKSALSHRIFSTFVSA